MRIRRLKLKNFGQHENLEHNTDYAVVGITGANGKGKTTILNGIEFALTGTLSGKKDSWLRNGASSGYVELEFSKDGKEGYIKRHLSNTRVLKWDGQEYKRAAEIDEILETIFSGDKQVIANALFIPQGEFNRLLFCGDAARRDFFIKLLNLHFCEKRQRKVQDKIIELRRGVIDYSQQRLDANERLEELLNAPLLQRENSLVSYQPTINYLNSFKYYNDRKTELRKKIDELQKKVAELEQKKATFKSLDGINSEIKDLEKVLSKIKSKISDLSNQKKNYELFISKKKLLDTNDGELKEVNGKINSFDLSSEEIDKKIKSLETEYSEQKKLLEETERAHKYHQLIPGLEEKLSAVQKDIEENESKSVVSGKLESIKLVVNALEMQYKSLKEILECNGSGSFSECPKCGLKLHGEQNITPERVEGVNNELSKNQKILKDLKNIHESYLARSKQLSADESSIKGSINAMKQAYDASLIDVSVDEQSEKVTTIKNNLEEYRSKNNDLTSLTRNKNYLETRIKELKSDLEAIGNFNDAIDFTAEIKANAELKTNSSMLEKLREERDTLKALLINIENTNAQLETSNIELANLKEPEKPDQVRKLFERFGEDHEVIFQQAQHWEEERLQQLGEIKQIKERITEQKNILEEITLKEQEVASKQKTIDQLEILGQLLSKDGLATKYLQAQFKSLTELTSKYLEIFESEFTVKVDTTRNFAFEFKKSSFWLPMEKLSGGEKVKLSTCFILAVQKLLCGNYNFLVMDEPSMHLDNTAVMALADVIDNLSKHLSNSNGQLWIVDHRDELEKSLSYNIKL